MANFTVTNTTANIVNVCAEDVAANGTATIDVSILHQRPKEAERLAELVNDGTLLITPPAVTGDRLSVEDYQATEWLFNILIDLDLGPLLDQLDIVGGAAVAAAGGDIALVGRNLLQGQTFDTLTLWATTSSVAITCLTPGDSGYTISVTDGATAGAEVVSVVGGTAWNIQIEVGVSTANQIATAINADAALSNGYLWAVSGGAGTTNAVQAATDMAGGAGSFASNAVYVGGLLALPANTTGATGVAAWTDTTLAVTTQAVGAATDVVQITVTSNNNKARAISATLV